MSFDRPVLISADGRDVMDGMRALIGEVQHYDWGSTTAIPHILGVEPDGRPWAELWLGAHPTAPSRLDDADGPTLDDVLAEDPSGIGAGAVDAFGPRLPYLLKILAAKQALSLQTHPSRAQAEEGFARDEEAGVPRDARERLYVDDWPKPEIMVALEDFHALCGFRDPIETADLFVAEGRIVSAKGRTIPPRSWDARTENTFAGFPMAVLVNRYSASASEIVAACLVTHQGRVVHAGALEAMEQTAAKVNA